MKKPNILFVMCDQMRFDVLRFRGCGEINTPNLDKLAERSVFFENAFTPNPICVPARAAITTGYYPHKCTGHKDNRGAIKPGFPLMGQIFKDNGYSTYAIGKLHYLPYTPPGTPNTTHGFDVAELCEEGRMVAEFDPMDETGGVEDYHDYLKTVGWGGWTRGDGMGNNDVFPNTATIPKEHFVDTWAADRSIAHLDKHYHESPEKPFFMWTSFVKPHSAYSPPRPYDAMYDPRAMSAPTGSIDDIRKRGLTYMYKNHREFMWDKFSPEAMKNIKAHYYGLITLQDEQIGRIIDNLEAKGVLNDTVIIYTADHGDMLGDFGLYFKSNMYNASIRVPFMVSYPEKMPCGTVSAALCGLQDILPTLLSLCGIDYSYNFDGMDLTTAVNGGGRKEYIGQCLTGSEQQYMLCDSSYKYIYHALNGIEELYTMDDIKELTNLAAEHPALTAKYKQSLTKWCVENGDETVINNGELVKYNDDISILSGFKGFGRRKY
jgi:arylsulfatase A-like enzyme